MTTSAVLGIPYIASQQNQPDVTHNQAVSLLQILLAGGAIQVGLNTPPGSPTEGDVYVIGESPSGAWVGRANAVAGWFLGSWLFVPGNDSDGNPIAMGGDQVGLQVWSKADDATFIWRDTPSSPADYRWEALPSGITTLTALTDTSIMTPQEYDSLLYVGGLWTNRSLNTIIVSSLADLPPADSSGDRYLQDFKTYKLAANVTVPEDMIAGIDNMITSVNFNAYTLAYSGTGTMLTGVDKDIFIDGLKLDAPNGGEYFNFSDTVAQTHVFNMQNCIGVSAGKYGTFTDLLGVNINNANCLDADDGLTITGPDNFVVSLTRFFIDMTGNVASPGPIGLDLGTSVSDNIALRDVIMQGGANATGISGLPNSGNVTAGEVATVESCAFVGGIVPLAGITEDDIRWVFANSANVKDTEPDALASMNGNATATTIAAPSTPVLVAGTWTEQDVSHFTSDANGRVTYVGERPINLPIDVTVALAPVSGTNKLLKIFVAKNGTVINDTGTRRRADSGDPAAVSTVWQLRFEKDDYIEVFVSNESDSTNVLAEDAIFRVR